MSALQEPIALKSLAKSDIVSGSWAGTSSQPSASAPTVMEFRPVPESAFRSVDCVERWLGTADPLGSVAPYSGVARINQSKQTPALRHGSAASRSEGVRCTSWPQCWLCCQRCSMPPAIMKSVASASRCADMAVRSAKIRATFWPAPHLPRYGARLSAFAEAAEPGGRETKGLGPRAVQRPEQDLRQHWCLT